MPKMLEIHDISFAYEDKEVIRGLSFGVNPGEIIGILGSNGAGKSTLIGLLSGILKPSKGEILIAGKSIGKIPARELARQVAVVPQGSPMPFAFTALEVVLMGRTPHLAPFGFESKEDLDIAYDSMRKTDSESFACRNINELSGGERQRVILARALAQKPSILLLDEPTTFLDIRHTNQFRSVLRQLNELENLTIVCALHDLNLASSICGRLMLLKEGTVAASGAPLDVITQSTILDVFDADVHIGQDPETNLPYCLPR